jgi:hypothetical protein
MIKWVEIAVCPYIFTFEELANTTHSMGWVEDHCLTFLTILQSKSLVFPYSPSHCLPACVVDKQSFLLLHTGRKAYKNIFLLFFYTDCVKGIQSGRGFQVSNRVHRPVLAQRHGCLTPIWFKSTANFSLLRPLRIRKVY